MSKNLTQNFKIHDVPLIKYQQQVFVKEKLSDTEETEYAIKMRKKRPSRPAKYS